MQKQRFLDGTPSPPPVRRLNRNFRVGREMATLSSLCVCPSCVVRIDLLLLGVAVVVDDNDDSNVVFVAEGGSSDAMWSRAWPAVGDPLLNTVTSQTSSLVMITAGTTKICAVPVVEAVCPSSVHAKAYDLRILQCSTVQRQQRQLDCGFFKYRLRLTREHCDKTGRGRNGRPAVF